MKSILPLLILLAAMPGCAERDDVYVTPRIVSIDPPVRKLPDDLVQSPWGPRPNHVVQVNQGGFETITVTFSSPPRNLRVDFHGYAFSPQEYIVEGTKLIVTVHCTIYFQGRRNTLYIKWDNDGKKIYDLYCPYAD